MASAMIAIGIDDVPFGTFVYNADGVCLGQVQQYWEMNGNRAAIERRVLNNGRRLDQWAYRKAILYHEAKENGPVFVKEKYEE